MIPTTWKVIAVSLVVFAAAFAGYWKGQTDGKFEQLKDSVEAYEAREKINARVQTATRYELCVTLGGLPNECDELRRMDETSKGQ